MCFFKISAPKIGKMTVADGHSTIYFFKISYLTKIKRQGECYEKKLFYHDRKKLKPEVLFEIFKKKVGRGSENLWNF